MELTLHENMLWYLSKVSNIWIYTHSRGSTAKAKLKSLCPPYYITSHSTVFDDIMLHRDL